MSAISGRIHGLLHGSQERHIQEWFGWMSFNAREQLGHRLVYVDALKNHVDAHRLGEPAELFKSLVRGFGMHAINEWPLPLDHPFRDFRRLAR